MKAELKPGHEINAGEWDAIALESPQGNIFVTSWYLNTISPGWQGICVYDKDKLQAIMPLWIQSKFMLNYALQPTFSKYWGICLAGRSFSNNYDEISWKKKIIEAVIDALPTDIMLFRYNFHPVFDYSLPFFQHDFELRLRYTYTIDLTLEQNVIEKNFSGSVKNKINKAAGSGLVIKYDNSIENILALITENEAAGKHILNKTYFPVFERLYKAAEACSQCFILTVFTAENEIASSGIFLSDKNRVYYLLGVVAPKHKQSAAMPFLVAHALKEAKLMGCTTFDFLGSMMEGIETFFRSFGGRPQPYTFIEKKKFPLTILKK